MAFKELDDMLDGLLRTTAEVHGIAAGSDVFYTLRIDSTRKHRSRSRSVASNIISLVCNIDNESANVEKCAFREDFCSNAQRWTKLT